MINVDIANVDNLSMLEKDIYKFNKDLLTKLNKNFYSKIYANKNITNMLITQGYVGFNNEYWFSTELEKIDLLNEVYKRYHVFIKYIPIKFVKEYIIDNISILHEIFNFHSEISYSYKYSLFISSLAYNIGFTKSIKDIMLNLEKLLELEPEYYLAKKLHFKITAIFYEYNNVILNRRLMISDNDSSVIEYIISDILLLNDLFIKILNTYANFEVDI